MIVLPPARTLLTDHSIVRYLERVYGLSLNALAAEILPPDRVAMVLAGARRIRAAADPDTGLPGYELVIDGQAVVSVLPR